MSPNDYSYIILLSIIFFSLLSFGTFGISKALKRVAKNELWDDKNR